MYYLIEKSFWDSWRQNPLSKFAEKKEIPNEINNKSLIEPNHTKRLRDIVNFGDQF